MGMSWIQNHNKRRIPTGNCVVEHRPQNRTSSKAWKQADAEPDHSGNARTIHRCWEIRRRRRLIIQFKPHSQWENRNHARTRWIRGDAFNAGSSWRKDRQYKGPVSGIKFRTSNSGFGNHSQKWNLVGTVDIVLRTRWTQCLDVKVYRGTRIEEAWWDIRPALGPLLVGWGLLRCSRISNVHARYQRRRAHPTSTWLIL